jgi:hypothetical protein
VKGSGKEGDDMANKHRRRSTWLQKWQLALCLAIGGLILSSCAQYTPLSPAEKTALYLAPGFESTTDFPLPAFLIREPEQSFNKIGVPRIDRSLGGDPRIFIDHQTPGIFWEKQEFETARGRYANIVYRIHFQEVPLAWSSLNLTAGKNPGILVIYTLDDAGTLVLVTTVHTCGCYLAFLPTSALPENAYPAGWSTEPQPIYGYYLPSRLNLFKEQPEGRIVFTLESETHRISSVNMVDAAAWKAHPHKVTMPLRPMLDLYSLPANGTAVSFFEMEGPRRGYVKNNTKILERLLISWWAFDLQVGEDKAYSVHDSSDTVFYTSLKFWAREASDLKNFPEFLKYWGWNL